MPPRRSPRLQLGARSIGSTGRLVFCFGPPGSRYCSLDASIGRTATSAGSPRHANGSAGVLALEPIRGDLQAHLAVAPMA